MRGDYRRSDCTRDYDGDGITDIAIARRGNDRRPLSTGIYGRAQITPPESNTGVLQAPTAILLDAPVPADYDGDGKYDLAVYRFGTPPDNNYIVLKSSDGGSIYQPWGNFTTDYILPGDYDGDGKADFAVARTGAAASAPLTLVD